MQPLDSTDLEILRLLAEDGRRPFSEIGEHVDLSGPAVSDRVDRLHEYGVIRRFTVDVDRATLRGGIPVLVRACADIGAVETVRDDLIAADAVEHVFTTVDGDVVFSAMAPPEGVREWVTALLDIDGVREYDVDLLGDVEWSRNLEGEFALTCAECGNTVTAEGTTTRVGGDLKGFCCPSCEARYVERYETLEEGA